MARMLRTLTLLIIMTMNVSAAVKIEKTNYKGWPNCYRLTNGEVELVVTTDVGPRVIRYGFVGGQNLFKEFDAEIGKSGESKWMPRGGHRIWFAPEDAKLTYPADNFPVTATVKGDTSTLLAPAEPETWLQKPNAVKHALSSTRVAVTDTIVT